MFFANGVSQTKLWLGFIQLDTEGGAATAGALDCGVLELEAGGLESLDVVDRAVDQVHGRGCVDEDL